MRCQKCKKELDKSQLIKSNIKGAENVDIVYNLSCPFCGLCLGQMYWGIWIPNGFLRQDEEKSPVEEHSNNLSFEEQENISQEENSRSRVPLDFETLKMNLQPLERRKEERRKTHLPVKFERRRNWESRRKRNNKSIDRKF